MPGKKDAVQVEKKIRLDTLTQEYKVASDQLRGELNEVNRSRLGERLIGLENEIHALERDIEETDSPCELKLENVSAARIQQNHSIEESFPFTNRSDELKNFKSSFCPPYILLDAPAGFGKTHLMVELGIHLTERNWVVIYALVKSLLTPEDLGRNISEALHVHAFYDMALQKGFSPGEAFGAALQNFWRAASNEQRPFEGFVLLLDSVDNDSKSLLLDLYSSFIPKIEVGLRNLKFFSEGRRFRVILGGRHLARPLNLAPVLFDVKHLSPFTFEAVHKGLIDYLSDHSWQKHTQLAAHLYYLTGGHPGCYAACAKDFANTPQAPDRYYEMSVSRLWNNFVKPYTAWAINALGEHSSIMEHLSLFRLCNNPVIKKSMENLKLKGDPYDLTDSLTGAYLLHREGRFLKDNIIRRLIVIKMRHEEPERFVDLCRKARKVCSDQILQPKVQSPERWVIEHLFLKVQEIAHLRETQIEFDGYEESFFDEDVPNILNELIYGRDIPLSKWREEQDALLDFIDKDWEFQFMINYAFRNPNYDEEPYQKLLGRIQAFLRVPRP